MVLISFLVMTCFRILIFGFTLGVIALWISIRSYEGRPFRPGTMSVHFFPNGVAGRLHLIIKGPKGEPIIGTKVVVEDISATSMGYTETKGDVTFDIAENLIVKIQVDEELIGKTTLLRKHDMSNGLTIVCVKR